MPTSRPAASWSRFERRMRSLRLSSVSSRSETSRATSSERNPPAKPSSSRARSRSPASLACSPRVPASEAEDEHERLIDGTEFARVEAPGGFAETLRVDDRRLLNEDACLLASDGDRWAKTRRTGARGGRRDEHGAEVEELVGLDDHRVAGAALLVPAHASGRRQAEELAADHVSPRAGRVRRAARG